MSKLQELIQRLCPDGVEYKKLGEICIFKRGDVLSSKDAVEGDVPVMAGGQKPSCYHNVPNRKGETIVVAGSGAYAGFVTYWNIPVFVSDAFSVHPIDGLLPKYVFHYLKNNQAKIHATKKGAGVPHVHGKDIAKFLIPVPPLEVQEEIVRILDRFDVYAAELQARKEQYEYYRNLLLTFNPAGCAGEADDEQEGSVTTWGGHSYPIQWKTMGEVMSICRGASPRPIHRFLTNSVNGLPWIKIGDVSANSKYITSTAQFITMEGVKKSRLLKKGDFILSNSMSFGRPYILAIDGCIHDGWVALSEYSDYFTADFLYHLLKSDLVQKYWRRNAGQGGAVSNLNSEIIASTPIPVPPLELQEKIVAILDRFETLVNDLSEGLPAEIAAVKEQYEYYRNRLLTFKEKTA